MIASIITLALILVLSYPVLAQDVTKPAETRKEKLATREAVLKVKLEKFKDKKKAEIAERVNTNLNRINQKQTEHMLKHLDRMSGILTKLENRINQASPDIKDPTSAKAAIASATASVKAQAEKDYTVVISSERKVKDDVKKVRDMLHTDLRNVRKQVVDAKQAVSNAIRVAKSGKLDLPGKEGTPSGRE